MVVPTPSEKSTIYKCVCRFSGTNVKTRKDGEDDYWTCPGCGSEYGPVQPYPGPVIATEPETPVPEATVTDEDAIQLLRGYWRDVAASFGEMEIKHMVELLEAFVASKLKAEPK